MQALGPEPKGRGSLGSLAFLVRQMVLQHLDTSPEGCCFTEEWVPALSSPKEEASGPFA